MSAKVKSSQLIFNTEKQLWCLTAEVEEGSGISGKKKQFIDLWLTQEQVANITSDYWKHFQ